MRKILIVVVVVAAIGLFVWGRVGSSGGKTTCEKFAAMNSQTGLLASPNDAQSSAIRRMLSDHNKSTDDLNVTLAYGQIIAYCNIYAGHSGGNQQQPIENIPGLR